MTEWHRAGTGSMRIDVHAAARVGLAMVDRHLRFVDVNQALAALDGIGAAEQVGRRIRDVLPSGLADEAIPVADADPRRGDRCRCCRRGHHRAPGSRAADSARQQAGLAVGFRSSTSTGASGRSLDISSRT